MTLGEGCPVCAHGWRGSTPLNFGKAGYFRRRLCPEHLEAVRAAERAYARERRRASA
jgi:hypothetical protein